jgi:uncharacterized protein (DUF2267 family)
MQTTHVDALDRTIQKTNEWLKAIQHELGAADRHEAYLALRAVLHALRDRLPPHEVLHLGAQLPMLVRGIFYEGWRLESGPGLARTRGEFLGAVVVEAGGANLGPEHAARAVFKVLRDRISAGEIDDVRSALPAGVRELWPLP